ncbi:hypothetical protein BY996DRAFT_3936291 [Phakopsora pachyrhizi]|nr:hypothetical protein BY996DRAFT_3936291 [Phakopsora pachyrhizi]
MNSSVSQLEGKLLKSARCRSISLNSLTNTTFQPGVPSPGLSELTSFHKNFPHTSEAKLKAAENRAYCSDRTDLENQAQPSLSAGFRDQARLLTRRSSSGSDQKLRLPILSNFQRTRADPIQEKKKLKYQDQSCPMSPRSQSEVGERTSTSQSDGSQGLSKEQCTSLLNFHPQPYSKVSSRLKLGVGRHKR